MNTLNISLKSFQELVKFRKALTGEHKPTKHPFLTKGNDGAFGVWRAFVTGNGKLLIHTGGRLRTFNFFEEKKWYSLIGNSDTAWENANRIWARAAIVRGGKQALVNGGWLQKRLYLGACFGRSWQLIALVSTFIPHIMDDAVNCPIIARGKIRAFIGWQGNLKQMEEFAKEWKWLGGVKIPFVPISRPEGLAFKPQHRRDMYYIMAINSTRFYTPDAHRWLMANQHRRFEIPHIDRRFAEYVTDGFQLKQTLEESGYQVPTIKDLDVVAWSKAVHELYDKEQTEIMLHRDASTNAMLLPGENLIPELEEFRIKTKGDLRRAGIECHHCVGSYANRENMAHYRKGNVVCQVEWMAPSSWCYSQERMYVPYVNQCYDFANNATHASEMFRAEVEKYLAKLTPDDVKKSMLPEQEEYDLFDTPIAIPVRRMQVEEFPF